MSQRRNHDAAFKARIPPLAVCESLPVATAVQGRDQGAGDPLQPARHAPCQACAFDFRRAPAVKSPLEAALSPFQGGWACARPDGAYTGLRLCSMRIFQGSDDSGAILHWEAGSRGERTGRHRAKIAPSR